MNDTHLLALAKMTTDLLTIRADRDTYRQRAEVAESKCVEWEAVFKNTQMEGFIASCDLEKATQLIAHKESQLQQHWSADNTGLQERDSAQSEAESLRRNLHAADSERTEALENCRAFQSEVARLREALVAIRAELQKDMFDVLINGKYEGIYKIIVELGREALEEQTL